MNACALEFGDGSFDCVLDKGTMDSILCGEGSINNVANLCMEVSRCVFFGMMGDHMKNQSIDCPASH